MNDREEQIAEMQAMLSRLTEWEKAQLVEMLVRKYGAEADIQALIDLAVGQETPRNEADQPPSDR